MYDIFSKTLNYLSFLINNFMKRNIAHKIRLYPNIEQSELIDKSIGCSRLMYNVMLSERKQVWEEYKENKEVVYGWKYRTPKQIKEEYPFMNEVDSQLFNWVGLNLSTAYNNFFKSLSGRRKGGKVGFPCFKKKKNGGSYTSSCIGKNIRFIDENTIKLPKIGKVKCKGFRNINGIIKSATVSRTPTGKYFCSVLFEQDVEPVEKVSLDENSKVIGLDMSMGEFYVDSTGKSPEYTKRYRKAEKRLKRLNHNLSRKMKTSNRSKKLRKSINLINEHIANQRKDFTHKLSRKLVDENDVIVVESLSMKAISQSLKLGKSVMDLGYSEFIRQLQYKCDWYGKHLVKADKWFASSKICHCCGYKYKDLTIDERKWVCPNCGTVINRDENPAINLRDLGIGYVRKCTLSQSVATA